MARRQLLAFAAFFVLAASGAALGQALDQLLKAVDQGDAKAVATFLDKGLDPNTTDKVGNTILMTASRQGHEELVKLLLERRADVARRGATGDTALMLASLKGHVGIAKMLIDRGAQISHSGWAPLHYAAFEGRAVVVSYLLDKGADKNAVAPNGYSALMLAARGGFSEAAKILLYEDADVSIRAPGGETVMSITRNRKDTELEELLRRAGAIE